MKKNCLILLMVPFALFGQSYPNVKVKEFYDANLNVVMSDATMETFDVDDDNSALIGDRCSKILSSLTKMYEATGDKAYLVKFVKNSFIIQNMRRDHAGSPGPPIWSYLVCCNTVYQDGYVLKAMAEFVYMIRNNSVIYNTSLPTASSLGINSQYYPSSGLITPFGLGYTYGGYAKWLGDEVDETLDWFVSHGYWDDSKGMIDPDNGNKTLALNMQPGFGLAFYYMGACDPNTGYVNKANIMGSLYNSAIDINDECDSETYNENVFKLSDLGNNSYVWFANGWYEPKHDCFPFYTNTDDYDKYLEHQEDLSHLVPDLWLPLAYMRFSPSSGYFDNSDMIRWRNMFTKNIYDNGDFHNNCFGSDACYTNGCTGTINDLKYASFELMPFYQWDGDDVTATTPNAYNIVMDLFVSDIEGNGNALPSGFNPPYYAGLADVVSAQWDMECVNLTLYNRDVVYSQDFNVKNKLIVAPEQVDNFHASNSNAFAEPTSMTNNKFIVESGSTVNMVAGEYVELNVGFEVLHGAEFTASVNTNSCTDGSRFASNTSSSSEQINLVSAKQDAILLKKESKNPEVEPLKINTYLRISPNPFKDVADIRFSVAESGSSMLKIMDQYGRMVFQQVQTEPGTYSIPFSGENLSGGVYYCILQINGRVVKSEKIVLIR